MQIKDLNSLLFLGGGSFSKALIFLGSGFTPRDEKIISKNAIYVFSKRTVFGVKCEISFIYCLHHLFKCQNVPIESFCGNNEIILHMACS